MRRRFFNNKTSEKIDLSKDYFKIEALEDGLTASLSNNACEYCVDNGSWTKLTANTNTAYINKGQILYFRGNLTPTSSSGIGTFTISKKCNVKGNIMSLLYYGNNFDVQTGLTGKDYTFYKLFYNCNNIVDASELILPATTLTSNCYAYMFTNCTNLTKAPALPATTLANYCYRSMFYDCTSLTTAPQLPATALAGNCYRSMFQGCTRLTKAPELPATTLASYCYSYMFYGCTSLTKAPELTATTLTSNCYAYMFYGCKSLTKAPELPATTLASYCYQSMFYYCTRLTKAPELPATTLASYCYQSMFYYCTRLTTAPELPATELASGCYSSIFYGCTSLTTAPALPATTLAEGCYDGMFSDTNVLPDCSNIDFSSESIVASGGLRGLFAGTKVTDTDLNRILPKNSDGKYCLPATTLANYCYRSMFYDCTNLTKAPELPATTLANYCYAYMFRNCSNLNKITMLATDISASYCLYNWVTNVSSTGTFIKNAAMTSLPTGTSGIPEGWAVEDYVETNLITFYIDNTQYQAEEGMTWEEWVNSEYNVNDYWLNSAGVVQISNYEFVTHNGSVNYVKHDDVIIASHNYGIRQGGGGGDN